MFAAIKEEKRLSLKHWRYQLLHWCFGEEAKTPEDSDLPKFLYTHYCPLFHLTNIIALLSPFIILIKVFVVFIGVVVACLKLIPWGWFVKPFTVAWSMIPEKDAEILKKAEEAAYHQRSIRLFIKHMSNCVSLKFSDIYNSWMFSYRLREEQAMEVFKQYLPKILEARRRAEERRKQFHDSIVFWTNFSRVFVKSALYVFYFAAGLGALWLAYEIAGPLWSAFCWLVEGFIWLFTDAGALAVLFFVGKCMFFGVLLGGLLIALTRTGVLNKLIEATTPVVSIALVPFSVFGIFWRWVITAFVATCEFVGMFYEANCPPITIVSEEEELVDNAVEGGVS